MFAKVQSMVPMGVDGVMVDVEVQVSAGLPTTRIVGLADAVTKESRERVLGAIQSAGFAVESRRVVVNLAPADVKKEGAALDLPIALSFLMAHGALARRRDEDMVVVGELSLTGAVKGVTGVLAMADAARRLGRRRIMVPRENAPEAALVEGIEVLAVPSLGEAVRHLGAGPDIPAFALEPGAAPAVRGDGPDFRDVQGQLLARRALEIAAAGGHNVLMIGPPGVGKTMLAQRLPGILPPLVFEEAIEVTKIHSVAGLLASGEGMVRTRPFCAPHHTVSGAGLVGGGARLRPGGVSLAHRGVLFLDELSEFPRYSLELLRQPIEDRRVTLARAARTITYPASFMLVASMNPCPCGHAGSPSRRCDCSPAMVRRHWQRLSGPLLDRIDLVLEVPPVPVETISRGAGGEPSAAIRARVCAARARQERRHGSTGVRANAELPVPHLRRLVPLDAAGRAAIEAAAESAKLSARAFHRVLKVARTIADLEGDEVVGLRHATEALAFRLTESELGAAAMDKP